MWAIFITFVRILTYLSRYLLMKCLRIDFLSVLMVSNIIQITSTSVLGIKHILHLCRLCLYNLPHICKKRCEVIKEIIWRSHALLCISILLFMNITFLQKPRRGWTLMCSFSVLCDLTVEFMDNVGVISLASSYYETMQCVIFVFQALTFDMFPSL